MFSQVCVILFTGGCMVARGRVWLLGGMHGCQGVGMHGCLGACVVAGGTYVVAIGHAWLLDGHAWLLGGMGGICGCWGGGGGGHGWFLGGGAWLLGGMHGCWCEAFSVVFMVCLQGNYTGCNLLGYFTQ